MRAFVFTAVLILFASPAIASFHTGPGGSGGGTGGTGGDGCGGCGVPPELEEMAATLEKSFAETEQLTLLRQRWAGTLCENHTCGDISEIQAKDLLDQITVRKQRKRDNDLSLIGVVGGILGSLTAVFALVHSVLVARRARRTEERSTRNETLIQVMRDGEIK